MADKKTEKKIEPKFEKQIPSNVVALDSARCSCEGCKKKSERAGFCAEHFEWFKAGLITKEGMKAPDFDKKYYHYTAKKAS